MVYLTRNKYGNKKVQADGYTFDSKAEAKRYSELKLWQVSQAINTLEVHPEFVISIERTRVCKTIMDFAYYRDGQLVVEDVKGKDNDLSRLKRKLVEAQYGIKVQLITKGRR